jgi:hypothetical protein
MRRDYHIIISIDIIERMIRKILTALPAKPPAISAKPMNKNNLALQMIFGSPPKLSPDNNRSSSIKLMMSMPSVVKMPDNQSTKSTWNEMESYRGGFACLESAQASKKSAQASANCDHGERGYIGG